MTVHQCPFCQLRFRWRNGLVSHLGEEHRTFHHDYPSPSKVVTDEEPTHNDFLGHGL